MMLLYFHSDKGTICGENKFDRNENHIPHPYNCDMYIICTNDHTFSQEAYVYGHVDGKHVFNPVTRTSDWKKDVACAKQECK